MRYRIRAVLSARFRWQLALDSEHNREIDKLLHFVQRFYELPELSGVGVHHVYPTKQLHHRMGHRDTRHRIYSRIQPFNKHGHGERTININNPPRRQRDRRIPRLHIRRESGHGKRFHCADGARSARYSRIEWGGRVWVRVRIACRIRRSNIRRYSDWIFHGSESLHDKCMEHQR